MSHDDILRRTADVVADVLDLDDLVLEPHMTAKDVDGWDSISTVEIMVALESEFGVRFRTGEMATMESIGDLVARIAEHVG